MIPIKQDNVSYQQIRLDDFISKLHKGRFSIPYFQRRFVWKNSDVAKLGDSIIRGFPISSLLLMPKNGSLQVEDAAVQGLTMSSRPEEVRYILDGQQRSTSIAMIFGNPGTGFAWYYDMLTMLDDAWPEDNLTETQAAKELFPEAAPKDDLLCCLKQYGRSNSEPSATMQNGRYIWAGTAVNGAAHASIYNFVTRSLNRYEELSEDACERYTNYLVEVLQRVRNYTINAAHLDEDCDLGVVIKVFETTNTQGRKLSLIDLLAAKTFGRGPGGDSIKAVLAGEATKWVAEGSPVRAATETILRNGRTSGDFNDLMRLCNVIFNAHLLENDQDLARLNRAEVLKPSSDFWFSQWQRHRAALNEVMAWIAREGLHEVSMMTPLLHVMSIFLLEPEAMKNDKFTEQLKLYLIKLSLSGKSLTKADAKDIRKIYEFAKVVARSSYDEARRTMSLPYFEMDPEIISPEALRQNPGTGNSKKMNCFLHLMYHSQRHRFTTDLTGSKIYYDRYGDLDTHHVFPRAKFGTQAGSNSIANMVKIDKRTNRHGFSDRLPSDYLRQLIAENPDGAHALEDNLIPLNAALQNDYKLFLQQRSELLSEYYAQVLGLTKATREL
jgi:hypothetical protein